MIFSVEELLPVFGDNFEGFCDLFETEQIEFVKKYARRAEAYIDRMSFYRLKDAAEKFPDDVKLAVCAVSALIKNEDEGGNITSENTDGYSVTYKEPKDVYVKRKIKEVCMDYLGHTGIFERTMGLL